MARSAQPALLLPETASTYAVKAGFACPIQLFAAAPRNAYYSKRKNETDFIKELATKFLHHLMHINNITRLYANSASKSLVFDATQQNI